MKRSLRSELFWQTIVLSGILIVLIGVYLTSFLFKQESQNAHNLIAQHNNSINLLIDGYFTEISHSVELLSRNTQIKNADVSSRETREKILNHYKQIQAINNNIAYIYSAYTDYGLLVNNYLPGSNYDVTTRPWYKAAVKSYPQISIGEPYREYLSGDWIIATSKAFSRNGEIYGAVGIDCSIADITSLLQTSVSKYDNIENFIINTSGKIIIHPNQDYLNKHLNSLFAEEIHFTSHRGYIETRHCDRAIFYHTIDTTGWVIVTVIDMKQIQKPIWHMIVLVLLVISTLALLWGYIQSILLSKKIVTPLVELRKQVKNSTEGIPVGNYDYPPNDIGFLAQDVKKIVAGNIDATNSEIIAINRELNRTNRALEAERKQLETLANTDPLTGLSNRYKINISLQDAWNAAKRYNTTFSVIMLDIDHFKRVNDTYGHHTGDLVLIDFAKIITENIRANDVAGRWGGEEFIIILPRADASRAYKVAEKLRVATQNHTFEIDGNITTSAGYCEYDSEHPLDYVLKSADQYLYEAKKGGRNVTMPQG